MLRTRLFKVASLAAICALAGWCAQKEKETEAPPKPAPARPAESNPKTPAGENPKQAPRLYVPLNPVQRFLMMTPEEQERVIEKAPPAEQARLRQAIDRFNLMPPAARARILQVYREVSALPPAQQALVTRQMNAFNKLPDQRREAMRDELRLLLRMSAAARESRFDGEEFKSKYSPEEQQMLRDLAWNLPPDYPLPGRAAPR
ncbi:MAG: DUF3106 domain-containing protein [Bryobacteraceae bacterium]